ncbi:corticotropin-releasing factor receptor 1 isoform X2 [Chrysemys picta bellii]|uniref:corticotropin-releasing factor receptor 1 isoform X2 n=1 Tax=Chrysemys picta bellii TaxID=8478 RepID=UPI0032B2FEE3
MCCTLTAPSRPRWNKLKGLQCNASIDLIGTCWPRSAVGQLVVLPCPEYINGVRYNTTNNGYRECLTNGSWAARVNYSQCQEILDEERKSKLHYRIAVIINYLGHCVSLGALLLAFVLFMRLRSIRCLRNIIHWNLITAFILRNATWFVVQLTMNPAVQASNVMLVREASRSLYRLHLPRPHDPGAPDQLHLLIQHRPNPHDQAPSLDHLGDHAIQESSEGHAGPAAAAGHHLHAVLRESGGRRDLPGRFHLLQLLPGIFPGLLCLRLLLLPEQRGPFRRAEEMAPVAGQALDPRPRGQSHVHPYVADTRQLPQHQAVDGCLSGEEAIAREGSQGLQQSRRYLHCRLSTACGPCTSRTDPQPHKHSRVPAGAGTVRHQRNPSPVSALGDQSSEKLFLILPNPCEARTSLAQDCGSGQYLVALARPTATEDNGPVTLSQGRLRAEQFPE